jgi:hypothetical protein
MINQTLLRTYDVFLARARCAPTSAAGAPRPAATPAAQALRLPGAHTHTHAHTRSGAHARASARHRRFPAPNRRRAPPAAPPQRRQGRERSVVARRPEHRARRALRSAVFPFMDCDTVSLPYTSSTAITNTIRLTLHSHLLLQYVRAPLGRSPTSHRTFRFQDSMFSTTTASAHASTHHYIVLLAQYRTQNANPNPVVILVTWFFDFLLSTLRHGRPRTALWSRADGSRRTAR